MKKIIIIIILSFLTSCTFSQKNQGKIIYSKEFVEKKVKKNSTDDEKVNAIKKSVFNMITKSSKNIEYELNFKHNISEFKLINNLESDNGKGETLASKMGGGAGVYYVDRSANLLLRQLDNFGETFIVKSKIDDIKWELINKKKTIGKFVCYKAISKTKRKGRKGEYYMKIIAWYCPKIQVPFGPIGFGNLPGLILELNYNDKVFYKFKEMKLSNNIDLEIKKPNKGKELSINEYDDIIIKMINKKRMH